MKIDATPPASPASSAPAHPPSARGSLGRLVDGAILISLFLLAFLLASFAASNAQVWFDLASGRVLAEGAHSFGQDPFSFGAAERIWVHHDWLYDLGLYGLYQLGSDAWMVVAKGLLVGLLMGLLLLLKPAKQPTWLWGLLGLVALVALAPALELNSRLISLVFLAGTLVLLERVPARRGSWRFPVCLAMLFAFWANLDRWFFLGPLVVGIVLLGTLLHRLLGDDADDVENEVGHDPLVLTYALLMGLIGTLANPFFYAIWNLPVELVSSDFVATLKDDPFHRQLFLTPFEPEFYSGRRTGNALNPLAFFLLVGVSALGMALNYQRLHWTQILIWAGFVLLTSIHVGMMPFLVVLAYPIAAGNLGALLVAKSTQEPTRWQRIGTGIGRGLTLLLLLLGLAACRPGWLNRQADSPALARRVDWRIEAEPTFQAAAKKLKQWQEQGQLPDDLHGYANATEFAAYCAWFAPGVRMFYDARYDFHAPRAEAVAEINHTLREVAGANQKTALERLSKLFHTHELDYLVLSPENTQQNSFLSLMISPDWEIWALEGGVVILGFRSEELPETTPPAFDPVREAFGREVTPISKPALITPPRPRNFWDRYLSPPPAAPIETEESLRLQQLDAYQTYLQQEQRKRRVFLSLVVAGGAGNILRLNPLPETDEMLALRLLEIRASRRAIASQPDHPAGYLELAKVYDNPALHSALPRSLQQCTALERYLRRIPSPEAISRTESANAIEACQRLVGLHRNAGRLDLALERLQLAIDYLEQAPPRERTQEQNREHLKFLTEQVRWDGIMPQEVVDKLLDQYENRASQQENVLNRLNIALKLGLWQEAIQVFDAATESEELQEAAGPTQPAVLAQMIDVKIQAGMVDLVYQDLVELPLANLPPLLQATLRRLLYRAAVLVGDYESACEQGSLGANQGADPTTQAQALASLLLPIGSAELCREYLRVQMFNGYARFTQLLVSNIQRQVAIALLRLEQGKIPQAQAQLEVALDQEASQFAPNDRALAQRYLQAILKARQ